MSFILLVLLILVLLIGADLHDKQNKEIDSLKEKVRGIDKHREKLLNQLYKKRVKIRAIREVLK